MQNKGHQPPLIKLQFGKIDFKIMLAHYWLIPQELSKNYLAYSVLNDGGMKMKKEIFPLWNSEYCKQN